MKRICITVLFAACFFALLGVSEAKACVAPVETETGTMICYEKDVSMNNFYIEMRPTESGYYAVTMEFSIKNALDEQKTLNIGVPQYFYGALTKISNFAVSSKGSSVKTTLTDMKNNEEHSSSDPYYSTMYVWPVTLEAGEIAFFRSTFTVNTRADKKNMEYADIPLKALRFWGDGKTSVKAVLDSTMLNVYTYDRTPSIEPTVIEDTGALIWDIVKFDGKSNLSFYYNSDISVIAKYFTNTASDDIQKQVSELFRTRRYNEAIQLIDSEKSLSSNVNYRFMKMVCHEKLGNIDEVTKLLNELFTKDVCFSSNGEYDISEYIKKRMLYTYYDNAKDLGVSREMLNEILEEGTKTLTESKSFVFMSWVNKEIQHNKALIGKEYEGDNGSNVIPPQSGDLTAKDWFKQLSQPAVMTVGIVIIVVALFCVFGMLANNGSNGRKKEKKIKYTKR